MKFIAKLPLIVISLVLSFSQASSNDQLIQYQGRVVKVIDDDSIILLVNNDQLRIRLAQIDTPEKSQPYLRVSRKALSDLIAGKT